MYYVNKDQIEQRLRYIPHIRDTVKQLQEKERLDHVDQLALERILHIAIETITDVGSYIIDGFIMRDASSYEDIVEILAGEQVFPEALTKPLLELVKLRRPLVQDYFALNEAEIKPHLDTISKLLDAFSSAIYAYLDQEGIE